MRIKQTKEIRSYLKRLQTNIDANYQNDFLDGYVEIEDEKEKMNNDQTSVDVVIPSYRPDEKFSRLVKKLQEQEYPIGTIFVINTKAGRFPKEVEQMEKVKVSHIERREFDHGATRDMGMQMSKAEIVVFMTQDAVPADEYVIGNLVKVLEEEEG